MNSQEIIDYVMNTPHNTNPAILKQMLDANGGNAAHKEVVYVLGNMFNEPISEEDTEKVVDAIKTGKDIYQYMPYVDSNSVYFYNEKARAINFEWAEFEDDGGCTCDFTTNTLMSNIIFTSAQVNEITCAMIEQAKNNLSAFTIHRTEDDIYLTLGNRDDTENDGVCKITEEQCEELLAFYEAKFGVSLHKEEEEE